MRADERSCVRTLVRAYMCVRECARARARNAAHVSVCACALAGAGWRTCGYACGCVYK